MLKTKGKVFVESNTGKELIPYGAWIWQSDFAHRYDRMDAYLDNIKAKGFNTSGAYVHWWRLQDDIFAPINQPMMDRFDDFVGKCADRGLYCGISTRLSATSWTNQSQNGDYPWCFADRFYPEYEDDIRNGWMGAVATAPRPHDPQHRWTNYWNSYKTLWSEIAKKLDHHDNVWFAPWFYPWHGKDPKSGSWTSVQGKADFWENISHELYGADGVIRQESDKMMLWTTEGQGSKGSTQRAKDIIADPRNVVAPPTNQKILKNDPNPNTAGYRDLDPTGLGLLNNNICFGTNGHKPHSIEKGYNEAQKWYWNTDLERELNREMWVYAHDFMDKYNVPMIVHEMGCFTRSNPLNDPPPNWVLDGYRVKLEEIMRGDPMGIVYWLYDSNNETILTERYGEDLDGIGLLLKEFQPHLGNGGEEMSFEYENKETTEQKLELGKDEIVTTFIPRTTVTVPVGEKRIITLLDGERVRGVE